MDKNAIKKYAVWARRELISRVSQRAALYEITDKGFGDASADSVLGRVMSAEEKRQRQALIAQIREKGYEQVMEEIAYTWFNRFIALRFMEVNGYLPSRVRVFTDDENNFKPQILTEAINMELDGLDMEKVYALKNANDDDALFKYMIIVQCNALSGILPGMFQRISDYTELLFPDNLLREGSVIEQMVVLIPEEDWTDQVQIIGWLYQYYNTEPKDKVFADLKKNIKIRKDTIPAATQQFTPDWIVRYMVENSLGRLWLEGHPNDELKASWKYYLEETEQETGVKAQLAEIRKEYAALKPEDILAIDPCQGSGHILVYMFDVLVQIYESYGYTAREAAGSIVEHNIWGLDIDERATQLAYFSVMMKARQYDRRFFSRGIQPHVYSIPESNGIDTHTLDFFAAGKPDLSIQLKQLVSDFRDAKEYGSIVKISQIDINSLKRRIKEIEEDSTPSLYSAQAVELLAPIIYVAQVLSQQYHVVVTNPPYMGANNMEASLSNYIKCEYPDSKTDLSTVFMEKNLLLAGQGSFVAMINIPVWMFLSSYEELRKKLLASTHFINLLHLGRGVFGADFGTTSFVIRKRNVKGYIGHYRKLYDRQGSVDDNDKKISLFLSGYGKYYREQDKFWNVPGYCIAYSASDELLSAFSNGKRLDSFSEPKQGLATADNNRFLRFWFEVPNHEIALSCASHEEAAENGKKWFPYNKGGGYRKWYGNNEYVILWENDGKELCSFKKSVIRSPQFYFRECLSWCKVTISGFSMRYIPTGFLFDVAGCSLFLSKEKLNYVLGYANSRVNATILSIISPTVNYEVGHVASLPIIESEEYFDEVSSLVQENIALAKAEWDSYESSWDFAKHPFIEEFEKARQKGKTLTVEEAFNAWKITSDLRFRKLKENEERLNYIFNVIYGLDKELTDIIDESDIALRRANEIQDIKSFISYAVGCMFGRYSIDKAGLIYAGGDWDSSAYKTFLPDADSILPISDDDYFSDDIVGRFIEFLRVAFGDSNLEQNLAYIGNALGGKGTARDSIREYFLSYFYQDHLKNYQKRPIYWLFDSGKKNGFKCLIYSHRYRQDTIARIRTDYVHEQQSRYRTAIADVESRLLNASTAERVKISKQHEKLQAQAQEIGAYEEKIHHLADQMIRIDLNDGVKHNYELFKDVLAQIK